LKFLRKHKIIHCDLKPENILLKQPTKSGIRLIDFGSSCFESEKLYSYIQSRFYRSPDVILGLSYTTQIDMWSFGCLLAELFMGYPLFPGENEHDQILAMMEMLGLPNTGILDKAPRKKLFFDEGNVPKIVPNSKGKIRNPSTLNINSVLNCPDEKFVDLIIKCLEYDPDKRLTPDEALVHDWILEGLPPSLHMKHLKLVENDENPYSSITSNFGSQQGSVSHTQPASQAQSNFATTQYVEKNNSAVNTMPTQPSQIDTNISSSATSSITNSVHIRKINNLIFNNNASQPKVLETVSNSGNTSSTNQSRGKEQSREKYGATHYIPKEFSRNAVNSKRKSKRSINLNIKSETTAEDDSSVINITINLTGAKQHGINRSIGAGDELHPQEKYEDTKKIHSTKNSKINLLNNFFHPGPLPYGQKKFNTLAPNTKRNDGEFSSPLETINGQSPKGNMSSKSPTTKQQPKSLERTPKNGGVGGHIGSDPRAIYNTKDYLIHGNLSKLPSHLQPQQPFFPTLKYGAAHK
jgi:serine/threonine protein kinase